MIRCDCAICARGPRDNRTALHLPCKRPNVHRRDTGTDSHPMSARKHLGGRCRDHDPRAYDSHGFRRLRRFRRARGGHMPVFASAETMADLERVYEFASKRPSPRPVT